MPGGKPTGSPGQWYVGGSGELKPNSTIDERTRKLNNLYESERLAIVPYDQDRKKSDQSNQQGESKFDGNGSPAFDDTIEPLGKLKLPPDHSNEDYARMGGIMSLVYLAGMVLIWFCPETKGQPLPE